VLDAMRQELLRIGEDTGRKPGQQREHDKGRLAFAQAAAERMAADRTRYLPDEATAPANRLARAESRRRDECPRSKRQRPGDLAIAGLAEAGVRLRQA
jgi:hypothetical protein